MRSRLCVSVLDGGRNPGQTSGARKRSVGMCQRERERSSTRSGMGHFPFPVCGAFASIAERSTCFGQKSAVVYNRIGIIISTTSSSVELSKSGKIKVGLFFL